jgi:phospholipid/cholesterol/gamma-HCH transport system substrate-binding protein
MQKNKRRYLLYGILGAVILFVAVWGFNFLKGSTLFKSTNAYYIYYDRIEGLNESSPVMVNGYKIGQVTDITFLPERNSSLLVKIEISNDFLLPDSTVARISSMDLMGSKGIALIFSGKKTYHSPKDTLVGEVEQSLKDQVSYQMLPVKNQAETLMKEISNAIEIVTYIFNEETRDNLEKSFASIKTTLFYLENSAFGLDTLLTQESGKISRILSNVEFITLNLKNNSDQITNVFTNLSTFSDTLVALNVSKTIMEANNALASFNAIMDKINRGEGTIGQLVQDNKLAIQLENAAMNLDKLLKDLRNNPKKYVNFSLMNIGRTVNVSDETELTPKDQRVLDRQRQKDENTYQKNLRKEQKTEEKQNNSEGNGSDNLESSVYFMIQIRAASTPIELNSSELKGYDNIVEKKIGNLYRYYIFPHVNSDFTGYYLGIVKEDFPDAYPVAFANEKQISYSQGLAVISNK